MTTKVTVDAHAGWPVKVIKHFKGNEQAKEEDVVFPMTHREFHIHDGMSISVEEMPKES